MTRDRKERREILIFFEIWIFAIIIPRYARWKRNDILTLSWADRGSNSAGHRSVNKNEIPVDHKRARDARSLLKTFFFFLFIFHMHTYNAYERKNKLWKSVWTLYASFEIETLPIVHTFTSTHVTHIRRKSTVSTALLAPLRGTKKYHDPRGVLRAPSLLIYI